MRRVGSYPARLELRCPVFQQPIIVIARRLCTTGRYDTGPEIGQIILRAVKLMGNKSRDMDTAVIVCALPELK